MQFPETMNRREFLAQTFLTPAVVLCAESQVFSEPPEKYSKIIGVTNRHEVKRISELTNELMERFSLPGLSIAIAYRGKLKMTACMGYADQEKKIPVNPQHLFRVASVSKPITSAAVMKLVEQGKLKLSDPVFGEGKYLSNYCSLHEISDSENRSRLEKITVRHLLEHNAGGWGNKKNDPMFLVEPLEYDHLKLIRWTVEKMPLESEPGTNYSYSNFGYCLLGRVIESVTGQSYEDAVRQLVLDPSGIISMTIGRQKRKDQFENEVVYYGQHSPYNRFMNVTRMDSHGGWIATPSDLVRFVVHVDGFNFPKDILAENSIQEMVTPSNANKNYAKGWSVNRFNNWWHMGGFNGGSSVMARISDGHAWAAITNIRPSDPEFSGQFDGLPWKIKKAVNRWGNHDLFKKQG